MQGAIFDLDGTLVHSLPGIARAVNHALTQHGYPNHSEHAIRSFIGDGLWMTCRRALPIEVPDEDVERIRQDQEQYYAHHWREGTTIFAGVHDMLHDLQSAGTPMAVLSNKPHSFTTEIMTALFPDLRFARILGARPGHTTKPDPSGALEIAQALQCSPGDFVLVGDSTIDFHTARNAGMQSVLVTWGYHGRQALEQTGGRLVDTVSDLHQTLAAPRPA